MIRFLRDPHAAATALGAAVGSIMCLAGVSLTSDHIHLVYQRDVIQFAAEAASLAATRHFQILDKTLTDQQIKNTLEPVARRYVLANLPARLRARAQDSLRLTLRANRNAGVVRVEAAADLGGALFGRWLWGTVVNTVEVDAGSKQSLSTVEVVLAIDITESMVYSLDGQTMAPNRPASRMEIVKRVAQTLVRMLQSETTAIGLVPWHYMVKLDSALQTWWKTHGWVQYPETRWYPPVYTNQQGVQETLPALGTQTWQGCLDQRSLCTLRSITDNQYWSGCVPDHEAQGTSPPGLSLAPPSRTAPLTMAFYPARGPYPERYIVAYTCRPDLMHFCYDDSSVPAADRQGAHYTRRPPQFGCQQEAPPILPLTTDAETVIQTLRSLQPEGSATYSTVGLVWAHRMLAPTWRTVWGANRTYPVDPAAVPHVKKAVVLLTDGEDNHLWAAAVRTHQAHICRQIKDDGILLFTIAAMDTTHAKFTQLREALTQCASRPEYAFINNATPEALERTFRVIGRTLSALRRVE